MKVIRKLGPADHGRPVDLDEFMVADYRGGYQYEVIDGKLYDLSPQPNVSQHRLELWLYGALLVYQASHPKVINWLAVKGRVFVPGRGGITVPEPDLAAYDDFPLDLPADEIRWENLSPILVGEVVSAETADKDLVRNVDLYLQVPSIKEYWVLDGRENGDQPMMRVFRRRGSKWTRIEVPFGESYETKLLPGFKLKIDPRS